MDRIDLTLTDHSILTIYVDEYGSFIEDISADMPMFITRAEYVEVEEEDDPSKHTVCNLILIDGTVIRCGVDDPELYSEQPLVQSCDDISVLDLFRARAMREKNLDGRLTSAYAVINNIPNLELRSKMHGEYLKRKEGFVAAMEALVDGLFRNGASDV